MPENLQMIGKGLVLVGGLVVIIGLLLLYIDKIPYLGNLPGDIYIKKENFTFYLPLATCILMSILLTIIFYFIGKIR